MLELGERRPRFSSLLQLGPAKVVQPKQERSSICHFIVVVGEFGRDAR